MQNEQNFSSLDWRSIIQTGLIAGAVTLFIAVIGMIESFADRDVIRQTLNLAQILLFVASTGGAYYFVMRELKEQSTPIIRLVVGAVIGLVSSIPLVALVVIATNIDVRWMFVNVNPALMEILTFEQESVTTGLLQLVIAMTIAGVIGAVLTLLPTRVRTVLVTATFSAVMIGLLGEIIADRMEDFFPEEFVETFFRRDSLTVTGAITAFVLSAGASILWMLRGKQFQNAISGRNAQGKRKIGVLTVPQLIAYGAFALFLLFLPAIGGRFISNILADVGLFMLMGLGLNIAVGLAGLLDLGYVTNFAIGAYIAAIITSEAREGLLGNVGAFIQVPATEIYISTFWVVLPICLLAAMAAGFVLAIPVLKMRGDYLAIATLGFGEIIGKLLKWDQLKPLTGGPQGIAQIARPNILGFEFTRPEHFYYLILVACIITIIVSIRLNNSRTGRQWMAIREDEDVAAAMGIDTAVSKVLAFTLSAATGGVAGAIFATKVLAINPDSFIVEKSIFTLSIIIIGGIGSIPGVILGAIVLIGLPELLREFGDFRFLIYGALLVFMMLARPEGLWPSAASRRESGAGFDPDTEADGELVIAGAGD